VASVTSPIRWLLTLHPDCVYYFLEEPVPLHLLCLISMMIIIHSLLRDTLESIPRMRYVLVVYTPPPVNGEQVVLVSLSASGDGEDY
jgi:hypothetical protein